MTFSDDTLERFAAEGATLPPADKEGYVEHDGAKLWYACFGNGLPVVLLHGGLGHSGNWAHQVSALVEAGYRAVVVDTRGHGRSTRDEKPFGYKLLAADVLAALNALRLERPALVGWSDGACTALVLAASHPERVAGLLFFACNTDARGTKPFVPTPVIDRCFARHQKDYAALSPTPDGFDALLAALGPMQRDEPNYSPRDLAAISVSVTVVHAEHDEFIKPMHSAYLAATIPAASLVKLPGVSHFAPLQRPDRFNAVMLDLLSTLPIR